jgi:DNA polymerase-3 subunit epsilon
MFDWLRPKPGGTPGDERLVVVDVETSGLDPLSDRVLAVAALALRGARIDWADSFECVLQQQMPSSKANILLHGIGARMQREGLPPEQALAAFVDWVASAPLVGFHSAFDKAMLDRACKRFVGRTLAGPWLDLAQLAPVVVHGVKHPGLDAWLAHFGLEVAVRHQAASDVIATAELLQALLPHARRELGLAPGAPCPAARLIKLAAQAKWIGER